MWNVEWQPIDHSLSCLIQHNCYEWNFLAILFGTACHSAFFQPPHISSQFFHFCYIISTPEFPGSQSAIWVNTIEITAGGRIAWKYIASAQLAGKHLHNEDHHKGAVATDGGFSPAAANCLKSRHSESESSSSISSRGMTRAVFSWAGTGGIWSLRG